MLDLPHGATVEDTDRMLMMAAERLKTLPELVSIQAYSGTASPFNFNGLVRHYYLRENPSTAISRSTSCRKGSARARAMRSRSTSAAGSRICRCPSARRSRSSRFRLGPRCWRRCWPRSTDRTPRRGAQRRRRFARPSSWSISSSTSMTATASRRTGCASRSIRRRSSSTASRSRRSMIRSARLSAA